MKTMLVVLDSFQRFQTVTIDGATNSSLTENEAIYVRYLHDMLV